MDRHVLDHKIWLENYNESMNDNERIKVAARFIQDAEVYRVTDVNVVLAPEKWRRKVYAVIAHRYYRNLFLLLILGHMSLCFFEPDAFSSVYNTLIPQNVLYSSRVVLIIELAIVLLYAIDCTVLIGMFKSDFLKKKRRVFYACFTIIMLSDVMIALIGSFLSPVFWIFRFSRPLRSIFLILKIKRIRGMFTTILYTVRGVAELSIVLGMFLLVFGILGVQLFAGVYRTTDGQIPDSHFDDIMASILSLFVLLTTENYPHIMIPGLKEDTFNFLFFFFFILLGTFVFMSVLLAVIFDVYKDEYRRKAIYERVSQRLNLMTAFEVLDGRRRRGYLRFGQFAAVFAHLEGLASKYEEKKRKTGCLWRRKTDENDAEIAGTAMKRIPHVKKIAKEEEEENEEEEREQQQEENEEESEIESDSNSSFPSDWETDDDLDGGDLVPEVLKGTPFIDRVREVFDMLDADATDMLNPYEFLEFSDVLKYDVIKVKQIFHMNSGDRQSARATLLKFLKSCYMKLPKVNEKIRKVALRVVDSAWFSILIFLAIIANTVILCLFRYGQSEAEQSLFIQLDTVFLALFVSEMIIKFMAYGIVEFFQDAFNRIDAIVVLGSLFAVFFGELRGSIGFRVLRVLRAIKSVRVLGMDVRFRVFGAALIRTVPVLFSVGGAVFVVIYFYAVVGVEAFASKVDISYPEFNYSTSFNTFSNSLLSLFQLTTGSNWHEIMFATMNQTNNPYTSWYFVSFMIVVVILIMNILVAIIVSIFNLQHDVVKARMKTRPWAQRSMLERAKGAGILRRNRQKKRKQGGLKYLLKTGVDNMGAGKWGAQDVELSGLQVIGSHMHRKKPAKKDEDMNITLTKQTESRDWVISEMSMADIHSAERSALKISAKHDENEKSGRKSPNQSMMATVMLAERLKKKTLLRLGKKDRKRSEK